MLVYKGNCTTATVMVDEIDKTTIEQIIALVNDPSFTSPVVIMPDCHAGKGSVIGFTMELGDRIIPNIVGVDLSCGVLSVRIDPKTIDSIGDLTEFDQKVRKAVPMNMNVHKKPVLNMERDFPYDEITAYSRKFVMAYNKKFDTKYPLVEYSYGSFEKMCEYVNIKPWYAQCSLGTLGGGNHYIEIGKDENGDGWVTVHSGSRNLGLKTASYWQKVAMADAKDRSTNLVTRVIKDIKETFPKKQWEYRIKAVTATIASIKGCEYLEGQHMMDYFMDSIFAHFYAKINREIMSYTVLDILGAKSEERILSVHNYIDFRDMIIRKGAISSRIGQQMLIPFNMEDGMLICLGRDNEEWNFSAPHGCGRLGSRRWAKEQFDSEKVKERMVEKGIFSSIIPTDEVPEAYKSSELIEKLIDPTAYIVHRVKPIFNFKA